MANEKVLDFHPDKIAKAEEILGYEFEDKPLLGAAITHPSARDKEKTLYDYERLEFLGDSILGAITAMYLFTQYRDLDEGGLTRIKVSLVSGKSLSRVAYDEGIADCIIFGESEAGTDKRGLPSALENVYESLVAALYLDGGMDVARSFILPFITEGKHAEADYKTRLQEIVQQNPEERLSYVVESESGPDHDKHFVVAVRFNSDRVARGEGRSKKAAEQCAAKEALKLLGVIKEK